MSVIDSACNVTNLSVPDAVLSAISEPLLICATSGEVRQWTSAAARLLGCSGDELAASRIVVDLLRSHSAELLPVTLPTGSGRTQLRLPPLEAGARPDTGLDVDVSRIPLEDGDYGLCVLLKPLLPRADPSPAALSEAQTRMLGQISASSRSGLLAFDATSQRCLLANSAAAAMPGRSVAEVTGLALQELQSDLSQKDLDALLDRLRSREAAFAVIQTHLRGTDGARLPVEIRLQYMPDVGRGVFFAVLRDTTQEALRITAYHTLQSRLARIMAHSPAGIVETDATGRMTFVNRRWCEMLGYDEAELLGMSVLDVTHADSLQTTHDALAVLAGGEEKTTVEKTYARKDGSLLSASSSVAAVRDEAGKLTGLTAIVVDISKRLEAEEKLRDSEQLLRQILDNTVALVGILKPDGTLIEANATALSGGGLDRSDVIGRKFWDCHWWSHDPEVMARLQQAVARAEAGEMQRYDEVVRMKGDNRITIDFMLSPIRGKDGQVELLVPSALDISDRIRSEQKLAYVMHEVNHRSKNLLSVVQSILRQMKPRDAPSFVTDFGQRLRALSVCQDLLVSSANEAVTLDVLVTSQLGHLRDLLGTRIRMEGPHLMVSPDGAQSLGMAIYELCTNAAKYGALSNDSGRVDIVWDLQRDPVAPSAAFCLNWTESGGPPVTEPKEIGFGSVVLGDMLAMTFKGTVGTEFAATGLRWHLCCPIENVAPA